MGKVTTTIRIDEKVLKEAKALGANISVLTETTLKEFIRRNKPSKRSSGDCDICVPEKKDNPNLLKMPLLKPICRRVSGQPSGESLRKLCPSIRLVGPEGPGREARQWHRNGTYRLAL